MENRKKPQSLTDVFRQGAEGKLERIQRRRSAWLRTKERVRSLHDLLADGKTPPPVKRRLTPEQVSDLRALLGVSSNTTRFIIWAELALHETARIKRVIEATPKRELKQLYADAERMNAFFAVLEGAESGDLSGLSTDNAFLFFIFSPILCDRMLASENAGQAWVMGDTGPAQARAWMEAIKDCAQFLLSGEATKGRGRPRDHLHQIVFAVLVQGFCRTQADPLPGAKDKFTKAATIVLTPLSGDERKQKARIHELRSRPRRLDDSATLQSELAKLKEAEKTISQSRDWVRKQAQAALDNKDWIKICYEALSSHGKK